MGKKTIHFEKFNSINNFIRTINSREMNSIFKEARTESSKEGSYDFCKTNSYKEAEELLTKGWSEPLENLKKGVADYKLTSTRNRTKTRYDVAGFQASVPRAIIGLPDSMINTTVIRQKVKAITLVYDGGANCRVKTDEYIKNVTKMLNIVNNLESRGIKVSLDLNFGAVKNNEVVDVRIKLKDFKDTLDIKKVAFVIAHPSMLRRIIFRWMERHPKMTETNFPWGYGSSLYMCDNSTLNEIKKVILKENEYYINFTDLSMENDIDKLINNLKIAV